jgi:hypothetical protein
MWEGQWVVGTLLWSSSLLKWCSESVGKKTSTKLFMSLRFEVLTSTNIKTVVFQDVIQCCLADRHRLLKRSCCFPFQCKRLTNMWYHIPDDHNLTTNCPLLLLWVLSEETVQFQHYVSQRTYQYTQLFPTTSEVSVWNLPMILAVLMFNNLSLLINVPLIR